MLLYLKKQFQDFFNINLEGDISHYFAKLLPKIIILFLIEQLVVSYFDNISNFIVTLTAFIGYVIFLYLVRKYDLNKYTKFKLYIYLFTLIAIIGWWFSSEGLLGSIGHYFSFSVFAVIMMFDEKAYKNF